MQTTTSLPAADLLYSDFAAEFATTRRFLERYPDGRGDFKPHDKSRNLNVLATHIADIPNRGVTVLTTEFLEVGARAGSTALDSAKELVAALDANVQKLNATLGKTDLDVLSHAWSVRHGSKV